MGCLKEGDSANRLRKLPGMLQTRQLTSSFKNPQTREEHNFFTPKGLHNTAQGRSRSERTLGWGRTGRANRGQPVCATLSGWKRTGPLSAPQGALAARATLGWVV